MIQDVIEETWELNHLTLSSELVQAKNELRTFLRNQNSDLAQLLTSGTHTVTPKSEDVSCLINDIALANKNLAQARLKIIALGFVIEAGHKAGLWKLTSPPVPVHIKGEKNPFKPGYIKNIKKSRTWSAIIPNSIQSNIPLSQRAKVGQLVLCAMTRGGLLQSNTIKSFLSQVGNKVCVINGLSYIDFSLRWRGHDDQEKRRWFPDHLTEILLITNTYSFEGKQREPWFYINGLMIELGIKNADRPRNMTHLIQMISLELHSQITPFLIHYATRGILSHSLKEKSWLRLQGAEISSVYTQVTDIETKGPMVSSHEENLAETQWLKLLRHALRRKTKKEAFNVLTELKNQLNPKNDAKFYTILCEWSEHLILKGSMHGRPLTLSTALNYVSKVANKLYGKVVEEDVTTFSPDSFEEIYVQILEDTISPDMRRSTARVLREFHYFLTQTYDIPKLSQSILGISGGLEAVDAHIISLEEYNKTLEHLRLGKLSLIHSDLPVIAQLMTIIAFKCGLRRSEVLKLQTIDFQGMVEPEILVRPNDLRRLKSANAKRRVRLLCFLDKNELGLLKSWVLKRLSQSEDKGNSEYLFSITDQQYIHVQEEAMFTAIHHAMREVTGEKSLRFHHLRHSCASWTILRLMVADHGIPDGVFESMPETFAWLEKSAKFKRELYQQKGPTKKHLFLVCSILGHSSPSMTLEHYIHWCDILLKHALQKSVEPLNIQVWMNAAHISQDIGYRLLKKGGPQEIVKRVRLDNDSTHLIPTRGLKKESTTSNEHSDCDSYNQIMEAYKILSLYSVTKEPIHKIAAFFCLKEYHVKEIVERAKKVADLRGKDRKSFRHRFETLPQTGERLLMPIQPKTKAGKALAEDFAKRLFSLKQSCPEDYTWIIEYVLNKPKRSTYIIFQDVDSANRFLVILAKMKINQQHINLTWHHGKAIKSMSDTKRKKYWRDQLCLSKNRKLENKRVNSISVLGDHGQLGLRLINYIKNNGAIDSSTDAFKFVYLMAHISF